MLVDRLRASPGRSASSPPAAGAGGALRRFVLANKALCLALTPRRYQPDRLYRRYDALVADLIAATPGQVVLDIGAGKWSSYAERLASRNRCRFVGLDPDPGELARNRFLDERLVADAAVEIPLPDASV